MRICILGDAFFVPVRNLARHLVEVGCEVHLISFGRLDLPPPIRVHPLATRGRLGLLLARRRVSDLVRRIRPDVAHAFYLTSYGWLAAGLREVPVLATGMGSDVFGAPDLSVWLRPLRNALARAAVRGAARLHSVADHMTDRMVELGANPSRISTFPRGVSLEKFRAAPADRPCSDPPTLVCNRKLEPVYDHRTLLVAAAALVARGTSFRLRIVGEGYLRRGLERSASRLGLDRHVRFDGAVEHEAMPEILSGSDLFVTASHSDGTSSCLLEAMAAGCIPVASDIPANRAWIDDGRDGFLFEAGNAEALARAVQAALDASDRWPAVRTANRERVASRGSMEAGHRRVIEIYRELLESGRVGA